MQQVQTAQSGTQKMRTQIKRGNPWSQFLLLSTRYLELLRNDVGNLLILLLQAPVIALMLVLMAHFEIGTGIFDANKLTGCSTRIITACWTTLPAPGPADRADRLSAGRTFSEC